MLAIKKGDDKIERGWQKKRLLAYVLRVLKTKKGLTGTLDWKNIDVSEFRTVHALPQMENENSGGLRYGETKSWSFNSPQR
jgi:hypothetical protein